MAQLRTIRLEFDEPISGYAPIEGKTVAEFLETVARQYKKSIYSVTVGKTDNPARVALGSNFGKLHDTVDGERALIFDVVTRDDVDIDEIVTLIRHDLEEVCRKFITVKGA